MDFTCFFFLLLFFRSLLLSLPPFTYRVRSLSPLRLPLLHIRLFFLFCTSVSHAIYVIRLSSLALFLPRSLSSLRLSVSLLNCSFFDFSLLSRNLKNTHLHMGIERNDTFIGIVSLFTPHVLWSSPSHSLSLSCAHA